MIKFHRSYQLKLEMNNIKTEKAIDKNCWNGGCYHRLLSKLIPKGVFSSPQMIYTSENACIINKCIYIFFKDQIEIKNKQLNIYSNNSKKNPFIL